MFKNAKPIISLLAAAVLSTSVFPPVFAEADNVTVAENQNTKPYIFEFNSATKYYANGTDPQKGGFHEIISEGENAPYLSLKYIADGAQANYFTMPRFSEKDLITQDHKYVRITYMTPDIAGGTITIKNNASGQKNILVSNTRESAGKWVTSDPVNVAASIITRFIGGGHNTIIYSNASPDAHLYIKEIAFFTNLEEAYTYYGQPYEGQTAIDYVAMTFGTDATGKVSENITYGNNEINPKTGAVDIKFAESTHWKDVYYLAKLLFTGKGMITPEFRWFRVAYSGKHPDGVETSKLIMRNDKTGADRYTIAENCGTNGKTVLSNTFTMTDDTFDRLSGTGTYTNCGHFSFYTDTKVDGGAYSIAAIYFFRSEEDANAFVLPEKVPVKININGNELSKYNIVIAKDAPASTVAAAELFMSHIYDMAGIELPIVTDETPVSDFEIRIGLSSRKDTDSFKGNYTSNAYTSSFDGNSLVITSAVAAYLTPAVDNYLRAFCYVGAAKVPEVITIDEKCVVEGTANTLSRYGKWPDKPNLENPTVITDDFKEETGYFSEDNGEDSWALTDNGIYKAKADGFSGTYIHVYEADVTVSAELAYSDKSASGDSSFGLIMRNTDKNCYIFAGYDVSKSEWFIDFSEGADFFRFRAESKPATLHEGKYYDIKACADGDTITLYCDGTEVLKAENIPQKTPGRIGLFAENLTLSADTFEASLDSGEGTVFKNTSFTLIPVDTYMEGGTVIEMPDGSLLYQHHHGKAFESKDGGYSWTERDTWATSSGYTNIIRLNDGQYLRTYKTKIGDVQCIISQTSADGGKTWADGGVITPATFENSGVANAGNMNDKLIQTASGLILYGQNYDAGSNKVEGRDVFCEFFYSNDLGKTWNKSETGSWEIEGNEGQQYFGECKLLECADGTIRMYNSWNKYGHIVYADSTDGGKSFGPLQRMEEFKCTHSSMQFARDPYAENGTTYYMVWVYNEPEAPGSNVPRNRLALAKTTDGKNWEYLGDIWRWEVDWRNGTAGVMVNHIVDPFIQVTKDRIIAGSGISRFVGTTYHNEQRQHIWSIAKDTLPEGKKLLPFSDVPFAANYYDGVVYAVENGLFNGTSANTFSPDAAMTRSMFVAVLGRLAKADVESYATPTFSDVVAGQWYTSYVEWAVASGIVNGLGNGIYGINDNITVQQACVILARYAGYKAASAKVGKTAADFADGASVASWAAKEVDWAIVNGVYAPNGNLNPTAPASRATVATMFANYVKAYGE